MIKHLVSPAHRRIYRMSGGRLFSKGRSFGPVLLLTTMGRRTGKEHTTPLFYLRDDERLIICNVNPGLERPNPWTLNLRAHPVVPVQVGQEAGTYRARGATEEEVGRYWPRLVEIWPAYQTHYNKSGQRSLFVLEPVRTAGEQQLSQKPQ
jgi:deazaflavin-dependent oxidoreductase (nitroreductase family)